MKYLSACIFTVFLFSSELLAHDFHVLEQALTQDQLVEFVNFAHEAAEAEDPTAGPVRQWVEKFNLYRRGINTVRWYNMGSEESRDHAWNLALMLSGSHAGETISAPIYLAYAKAAGVAPEIMVPTTAFLGSMAVPGIDWVCIVLIGTYIGSEDFREVLTGARVITIKTAQGVGPYLGVSQFLAAFMKHHPVDERLRQLLTHQKKAQFIHQDPALSHQFTILTQDKAQSFATLSFKRLLNGNLALEELRFNAPYLKSLWQIEERKKARAHLKWMLRAFGLNTKDAVLVAFDEIARANHARVVVSPFVTDLEYTEDGKRYRFAKVEEAHDHHHEGGHEHHHFEVKRLDTEPTPTLADDGIAVRFVLPAIQVKPKAYRDYWGVVKNYRGIARDVGVTWGNGIYQAANASAEGLYWLGNHPEWLIYGPVVGAGKAVNLTASAGFKTGKIGFQVIRSGADAALHVVGTLEGWYRAAKNLPVKVYERCRNAIIDWWTAG